MANQVFYERVEIYLNGQPYLPNGQIQSFRASARFSSKQLPGFTPDGTPAGQLFGNSEIDMSWSEILPSEADYQNISTLLKANPNAEITVIPFSIATGVQSAPNLAITGLVMTGQEIDVAGNSQEAMRRNTFTAATCSGLNV